MSSNWAAFSLLCNRTQGQWSAVSNDRWALVGEWALTTGHEWDADFLRVFAETQIAVWENPPNKGAGLAGWYYWTFKTEWGGQNTCTWTRRPTATCCTRLVRLFASFFQLAHVLPSDLSLCVRVCVLNSCRACLLVCRRGFSLARGYENHAQHDSAWMEA